MRIFACCGGSTGSCSAGAFATSSAARGSEAISLMVFERSGSPDELVPDRVVDKGGVAGEAEFAQDARAVGAHGGGRQPHLFGDLADLLAGGEQPHDAVLAVRQLLVQRLLRIARAFRGENLRQR